MHLAMDAIARRFSCAREQAVSAVEKLQNDYAAVRRREKALTAALNGYMAAELRAAAATVGGKRLILALLDDIDAARLKALSQEALPEDKALCVLLSRTDGRLAYAVACTKGFQPDAGELIQAVNAAVGGRGGGRGEFAQGMAPSAAGVTETLEQLRRYFHQRLA